MADNRNPNGLPQSWFSRPWSPLKRITAIVTLSSVCLAAGAAHADNPAIVIDVQSGKVLHAERATDPWYPASITKLMTVYVSLKAVRDGRAKMDQLLTVSAQAAAQKPSKMGFKPGTQIRLDNALKIIMVKSANDVAATIGENLGGSIENFAAMMNSAAREIGMQESHFVNPHGLPDERQYVSARDMAILGRTLLREFPEQSDLFQIGAIQMGKHVMRNHNGLIGRYPGADGMKTGFICASGFNLVGTATQNGRQLLAVVLGSPSAQERNLRTADLLDKGFSSFGMFSGNLFSMASNAGMAPPNLRSEVCGRKEPIQTDDDSAMLLSTGRADSGSVYAIHNPTTQLAYTGEAPATSLATRAPPVKPIPVWIGLYPPQPGDPDPLDPPKKADRRKAPPAQKAEKPAKPGPVAKPANDKSAKDKPATTASATPAKPAAAAVKPPVKPPVKPAAKGAEPLSLRPSAQ